MDNLLGNPGGPEDVVQMPGKIDIDPSLQKDILGDAIKGDKVDRLIIGKDTVMENPNFVFDFSKKKSISIMQTKVIKSMILGNVKKQEDPDNPDLVQVDTAIYFYKPNGLMKVGYGNKYELERMLPLIATHIFDNEVPVYKDYVNGESPVRIDKMSLGRYRLNL